MAKRISKADIYRKYGIEYKAGKINAPIFGWIKPLLIDGNEKLGKGAYHWSMLAGNYMWKINMANDNESNDTMEVLGTCHCNCPGCYAQRNNYCFKSCKQSLARKTILARLYPEFVRNAIIAQIQADKIHICRIHASGDFFNDSYIAMWLYIVNTCKTTVFWSYTKNEKAENAFNGCENCNIVKSIVPGIGLNYGHCSYIISTYYALKEQGKNVYICRCGIDKNQHCTTCKGCSKNEYVLFIEHSTEYKAEQDGLFPVLKSLIDSQSVQ